jgi:hypothetical protein
LAETPSVYEAFELSTTPGNGDVNAIRIDSTGANFQLAYAPPTGGPIPATPDLGVNDGAAHDFLLAIDFDTDTVTAYEDPASNFVVPATGGVSIAFDSSFRLDGITLAAFGPAASTSVDNLLVVAPEPATWVMMLGGLGLLLAVRRFRAGSISS